MLWVIRERRIAFFGKPTDILLPALPLALCVIIARVTLLLNLIALGLSYEER